MGGRGRKSTKGLIHYEAIYVLHVNFKHTYVYNKKKKKTETCWEMTPTNSKVEGKGERRWALSSIVNDSFF